MNNYILIVEDNELYIKSLETKLNELGYLTKVARNGLEGVKQVLKEKPLMVFMDIQMPEKNGYEATIEIKAYNSKIPVIAYTNQEDHAMKQVKIKCLKIGIDACLRKPAKIDKLQKVIEKFL